MIRRAIVFVLLLGTLGVPRAQAQTALPEVRLSDSVALFGGPGVTKIYNAYEKDSGNSTEFLGTLGLAVKL